jgi:hypothetical protein
MAPKSLSAKPAFGSKAKSTSSATKIKQELLRSRKPGQYFVFLCDDHLLHPIYICSRISPREENPQLEENQTGVVEGL